MLVFGTSCDQKKTVESVSAMTQECLSSSQTIKNRFVVQWEDGSFSIEKGNSLDEFRETFIKENLSLIKFVEPDQTVHLRPYSLSSAIQPNALSTTNWGPEMIEAPALWNQDIVGHDVIVGVIDSMVDVTHDQLRPNILVNENEIPNNGVDDDNNGFVDDFLGAKFNSEENDPNLNRHGSHVAGIIGADPEFGPIHGVAPKVKILPAQFMDNQGAGSLGHAIAAMNYAVSRGARILNLSWGGADCQQNFAAAMEALSNQGVLLVTAAGNGDYYGNGINVDENPDYPSAFNLMNQINVAASTADDFMIRFSNFGRKKVLVAAPGYEIDSTVPGNQVERMSGTSMAAPMTAGAAALLMSAFPAATTQQVKLALLRGVDVRAGHEFEVSTRGRINVRKSLSELQKILDL